MTSDLTDLREALLARWPDLLLHLLGEPSSRTSREWRWNRRGSLSAVMSGAKAGQWFDHEAGVGGGSIEIIARNISDDRRSAADWARRWLGHQPIEVSAAHKQRRSEDSGPEHQDTQRARRQAAARRAAEAIWSTASLVSSDHPYLARKRIGAHELRCDTANALIVPLRDLDGTIHTIQRIDEAGNKRFLAGGAKAGHFALIGGPLGETGQIILCEGWATGASLHAATGLPVVAAMDAGNLKHVAPLIRARYPGATIIIAADNDDKPGRSSNPGIEAATAAASAAQALVAVPSKRGDFNDLAVAAGLNTVRACIAAAAPPPRARPTYPAPTLSVDEARARLAAVIESFVARVPSHWHARAAAEARKEAAGPDDVLDSFSPPPDPPRLAVPVGAGLGKTAAARHALTGLIESGAMAGRKVVYSVPRHDLGAEQARAFAELGIEAMVWKGRTAPDPSPEAPDRLMCRDPDAPFDAMEVQMPVEQSVCKVKRGGIEHRCAFHGQCGYQAQKPRAAAAQVVICAHDSLFHERPTAVGEVGILVIDESFWQAGLRGIDGKAVLTLDGLRPVLATVECYDRRGRSDMAATADLMAARQKLWRVLDAAGHGAIPVTALKAASLTPSECRYAGGLERRRLRDPGLLPGMNPHVRRDRISKVLPADGAPYAPPGRAAAMWALLADALDGDHDAAGVVLFDDVSEKGSVRALRLKWRADLRDGWADGVPVLHLDATMRPDLVKLYLPDIEVAAAVEATQPHVTVRQILDTPTTARALMPSDDAPEAERRTAARHLRDLLTFIRLRAAQLRELDQCGTNVLVIGQMEAVARMREAGLPGNIEAVHFNALSGLDRWNSVRGLIVLGRTLPAPLTAESLATALTNCPTAPCRGRPAWWYETTTSGIRLADGSARQIDGPVHADPLAEAIRWSICEAELIQAVGRGRGVNRTAATPLAIDLLTDVVLPLTVGTVTNWAQVRPNRHDAMAAAGVMLENAADMARCFPELWSTHKAARNDRERSAPNDYYSIFYNRQMGHSSAAVRYQPAGAGQKMRRAIFDLAAIPDPQGWLEERLGALALFEADASRAGTPETSCVSGQTIPSCGFAASIPADVHSRLTALSHRLDAAIRRVLDDARGRLGDLAVVLIVSRPSTLVTLGDDPPFDPIVPAQRPLAPPPLRLVEHPETVPPQRPGESMFDWSCRAMQELQAAGVSYPRASRMVMKHDFRFVPAPEADEPIADEAAL